MLMRTSNRYDAAMRVRKWIQIVSLLLILEGMWHIAHGLPGATLNAVNPVPFVAWALRPVEVQRRYELLM